MCSKKFAKTVPDSDNVDVYVRRKRFFEGKEIVERMPLRKVQTGLYNVSIQSYIYKSLDHAAMVAADEIYSRSKSEQWKKEFGMLIFGNDGENEFILSKYKMQEGNDPQIVFISRDWGTRDYNGSKYGIKAVIHSHPTELTRHGDNLLFSYNNELSTADYYSYFTKQLDRVRPILYLVTNVGTSGTLIKFSPPKNTDGAEKGAAMIETACVAFGLTNESEKERLPRNTMVEIVKRIVNELGGKLEEFPIGFGNTIAWKMLSPRTILWRSHISDVTVGQDSNDKVNRNVLYWKKERHGEETTTMDERYDKRESAYDLRCTITHVIFDEGVTEIEAFAFMEFTNLVEVEIPWTVNKIGKCAFAGCGKLKKITIRAKKPPKLINYIGIDGVSAFNGLGSDTLFFVPVHSLNEYKKANGWSHWKSIFLPLSE